MKHAVFSLVGLKRMRKIKSRTLRLGLGTCLNVTNVAVSWPQKPWTGLQL